MTMPALPRAYVATDYTPNTGAVLHVAAGGNLQAALDAAKPGDTVTLEAGATFTGTFTLRPKVGPGTIIVRTATPDAALPAPGTRITPADAPKLARIVTPTTAAALTISSGASGYRLVGLEVTLAPTVTAWHYGLVILGDSGSLLAPPDRVTIDRCYIHGTPTSETIRGVALNGTNLAVVDSHISDIHCTGADSQAICGWNGQGPFRIANNYLEGAGENVMFGGAGSRSPEMMPADIEIVRNTFSKPLAWKAVQANGKVFVVKNLFELKVGRRVLFEGNTLVNCWAGGQYGVAIVVKSVDQNGGAPWSVSEDVTIRNNIIDGVEEGVHLIARDKPSTAGYTKRVLVENNLFKSVTGKRMFYLGIVSAYKDAAGVVLDVHNVGDVTIRHNTSVNTNTSSGILVQFAGPSGPAERFTFENNIAGAGAYGIFSADGYGGGPAMLSRYVPGAVIAGNVVVGGKAADYPAGNVTTPAFSDVFAGLATGDFHVRPSYATAGADPDEIARAMAPQVGPPPPPVDPTAELARLTAENAALATSLRTAEFEVSALEGMVEGARMDLAAETARADSLQSRLDATAAELVARSTELESARAIVGQAVELLQEVTL